MFFVYRDVGGEKSNLRIGLNKDTWGSGLLVSWHRNATEVCPVRCFNVFPSLTRRTEIESSSLSTVQTLPPLFLLLQSLTEFR
jgi:hypothetical protein